MSVSGRLVMCSAVIATMLSRALDAQAPASTERTAAGAAIPVNPASITFEQNGTGVEGFVLYVRRDRAEPVRIDLGPVRANHGNANVAVKIGLDVLPDGVYEIEVAAYNRAGESRRVPTDPHEFVMIRGVAGALLATTDSGGRGVPPTPNSSTTQQKTEPKRGGMFGKLWKILVGDDEQK